jgi:hypothetical protein
MGEWVLEHSNSASEKIRHSILLAARHTRIGERATLGVKGPTHQLYADKIGRQTSGGTHRHLDQLGSLRDCAIRAAIDPKRMPSN